MNNTPFISIIIPCRNEEKFISKCLDSLLEQDYPKNKTEILVVDGISNDGTAEIVKNYAQQYSSVKLFENSKKTTPCALNIGIDNAKGEIIFRMDTHAFYEKKYLSKCVKYMREYNVDNVGGYMVTLPRNDTLIGRAIALVLSHPFGVGNAIFRTGAKKPMFVDTVFGGCYKKDVFKNIGRFNNNLSRGQDMDLNLRLRKSGGKILLVPEIKSFYYSRSDLKSFWDHSFVDGQELIYPLKFGIIIFSWRHLVPLVFVSSLMIFGALSFFSTKFLYIFLTILGLYLTVNIYFSLKTAIREKNLKYLFVMPVLFIALHIGYGFGSVTGVVKYLWTLLKREKIAINI